MRYVNKLLLLVLVGLAASVFMLPFVPTNGDLIKADIYTSTDSVVLSSDQGQLKFDITIDKVYSSSDPYDFFPQLIDSSSIQRIEVIPYLSTVSCNVISSTGDTVSGDIHSCLALAVNLQLPVYVHKDLFSLSAFKVPGNLLN